MNSEVYVNCELGDAGTDSKMMQDSSGTEPPQSNQLDDPDTQIQLITALFNNDYPRFEELITNGDVDIEYTYKQPAPLTCLDFASIEPDKQEYVKLLLQHNAQINRLCSNYILRLAPIHHAARNGNLEALKVLLDDERVDVNIANECNVTALLYGIDKMMYLDDDEMKKCEDIIRLLLEAGSNTDTCDMWGNTPIYLAAEQGLINVVKMIIDHARDNNILMVRVNGETLLHVTVRGMGRNRNPKADFNGCLDLFLQYPMINVNQGDEDDDTALHYAARNGDNETILKLLRHGACVSLRNKNNETPLDDINAKTLATYLDECITTNGFIFRERDDDYEIRIDYSILAYTKNLINPNDNYIMEKNETDTLMSMTQKEISLTEKAETDVLMQMSVNEELRPLLKHPVITSFLYLKWHRISYLAYANITFYSLLWLSLILYIILGCDVEEKESGALNIVSLVGVIIGLILLIIRELFQLVISPMRYLQGYDNWMEILLIILIAWIIHHDSAHASTKQQQSAVAIIISSAELLLLIGRFPGSSTNMLMLKTVSWNFFKFLVWYCILIIAFALSFYTLFRQVVENEESESTEPANGSDEDADFFNDPGRALFKTMVMLTGEFDTGSIQFKLFPVTSRFIFIVFVFMIPIVLFNLLNGLAVSDTQKIRADAELVGHISRINLISHVERLFIAKPKSYNNSNEFWSWLTTRYIINSCINSLEAIFIKPLAKHILLFPHFLPEYRIVVKPNQDNQIWFPSREGYRASSRYTTCRFCFDNGCFARFQTYKLSGKIVQNAKNIISKYTNGTEFDKIKTKLLEYEANIDVINEMKATLLTNKMTIESLDLTLNKVLQTLERMSVSSDVNQTL